jgi:hypothetical protein
LAGADGVSGIGLEAGSIFFLETFSLAAGRRGDSGTVFLCAAGLRAAGFAFVFVAIPVPLKIHSWAQAF